MPPAPKGATISYLPSSTRPTSGSPLSCPEPCSGPTPSRPSVTNAPPAPCSTVGTESAEDAPPPDVRAPQLVQNCAPSRTGLRQFGQFISIADCGLQIAD